MSHIIKTITVLGFLIIPAFVAGQGNAHDADTETRMYTFEDAPCPFEATTDQLSQIDCGWVSVPENRDKPYGLSHSTDRPQESVEDPSAALTQIADRYVEEIIQARPFLVYIFLSEFYEPDHASMPDRSPEALNAFEKIEDETLEALMHIDLATLTERGDWVTWHTLKEKVEADPGLHLYGWSNEQAKAFMVEAAPQSDEAANDMLDRIAVTPGQLTAYDTGGLEIMDLRRLAEERLGDRFDIREFHDRVLENGALPLGALREYVEAWIEEVAAETGRE